jgi:hypothetical protein
MYRFGGLIFLVGLVIVGLSVFAEDLGITGEARAALAGSSRSAWESAPCWW